MPEWIYFIHAPRENFADTMTAEEEAVWDLHFEYLKRLHADGSLILAGPTLGTTNTGIVVFTAADGEQAQRTMDADPVVAGRFARGELREFRVSLLGPS